MARPAKPVLAEPTAEQLQIAFRELWRPGRPDTVEKMLLHPTLGVCLRGIARARHRVLTRNAGHQPVQAIIHQCVPPTPAMPPHRPKPPRSAPAERPAYLHRAAATKPRFDARKAAANDRDDD
jgi:hypothetical protein